jgi:hypothetical protein
MDLSNSIKTLTILNVSPQQNINPLVLPMLVHSGNIIYTKLLPEQEKWL